MNAVPSPVACFHCGLPVPGHGRWEARIDGVVRPMCCPGCAAAAQAIADAGFADYYGSRTEYAGRAGVASEDAPELALYDTQFDGEATFTIEGIRCAACVWLIERRLAQLTGVLEASLNVATERLHARWDGEACKPSDILRALRGIGYNAYPYDAKRHGEQLERARKKLFRQLFVAGLSMMQVMMYAVPVYLAGDGTMDASMTALMDWAGLLLTLPALLYSAQPFFRGAWLDLRRGVPGMDVPVALGIGAAFGGSLVALLRGAGEVYFDSITMFIFLLLGSRYLELDARRRAARALESLQQALPASALRMPGFPAARATELVAASALQPGDVIQVLPGQAVAADGVIVEGETEVDLALLTGESKTRRMGEGDVLPGGAVDAGQAVALRVTSAACDSTLALLVKLVERAGQGKPRVALWADKVAAGFVVALLLLTCAVFAVWHALDPSRAWQAAIAVLVVSCPCALSLATPTALAAATDRLLRRGVLAVQPHVLETLERATHIVFDKTGTLTMGRPVLRDAVALGGLTVDDCLRIACVLEAGNAHPLAQAFRDPGRVGTCAHAEASSVRSWELARGAHPTLCAEDLDYVVGQGVEGVIDGARYRFGSAAFVGDIVGSAAALTPADITGGAVGKTPAVIVGSAAGETPAGIAGGAAGETSAPGTQVWLGSNDGWLARFSLADGVRPEAAEVVRRFRRAGKTVVLLSGDEPQAAQRVATQLGIELAEGGQLPEQKLAFVRRLQEGGAVVAMVGDGVNDAAVLCGADVSFAMGGGAALAQLHADCVLMKEGLAPLADAADTARRTLRVIRQNLAWAAAYNFVAIPAAASGLLGPWLSGAGMAASSALVVLNALRLRGGK